MTVGRLKGRLPVFRPTTRPCSQEKDFLDYVDTEIDTSFRKPKKQLSEQKLQHLANIRVKGLNPVGAAATARDKV